jgi:hypothetical protein
MARLIQQATQLTEVTSTSDSETTAVSLTASLVSGKKYALFVSLEVACTGFGTAWYFRDVTGSSARLGAGYRGQSDSTDYFAQGRVHVFTAPATASRQFDLTYVRVASSGTAKVRNARIVLLELGANDHAVVGSDVSTSSTSYVDAATLTFTPPSDGDYLLIGSGYIYNSRAGARLLLSDGSTAVNPEEDVALTTTSGGDVWGAIWKETLTASSKTIKVQARSYSGTAGFAEPTLVALRLDDFHAAQVSQDDADDAGTNTSYTTSQSLAATGLDTAARDTIVLAALTISGSSTSLSVGGRLTEGGTERIVTFFEANATSAPVRNTSAALMAFVSAAAGSSITYNLDRISETGSVTATVRHAVIAVLEHSDAVPFEETAGSGAVEFAGQPAALLAGTGQLLGAGGAALVVTGHAPTVVAGTGQLLQAGAAAIEIAGHAADLLAGTGALLDAGAGAAAVTGHPASVSAGQLLAAAGAAVEITGGTATLAAGTGVLLTAGAGHVELTGHPATADITAGVELTAGVGEYLVAGAAAALVAGQVLAAAAATITVTGHPASLVAGTGQILQAGAAEITVAGHAASLTAGTGVRLTAGAGAVEWTGAAAAVAAGQLLAAGPGAVETAGGPAVLQTGLGQVLTAAPGEITLSGQAASLLAGIGQALDAGATAIEFTGHAPTLLAGAGAVLTAGPGLVEIAGHPVTISIVSGYQQTAGAGAYVVTGGRAVVVATAPYGPPVPAPGDLDALLESDRDALSFIFEVAPYVTSLGAEKWLRFCSHPITTGPAESVPSEEFVEGLVDFTFSQDLWSSGDDARGVILGESRANSAAAVLTTAAPGVRALFAVSAAGVREYHWTRRPARCLLGHPSWSYDDYVAIWTGHVSGEEIGEDEATIRLADVLEHLDEPIQERVYAGTRWDGVSASSLTPGTGSRTFVLTDLVSNGGFPSNLSGWVAGTGWAQSGGAAVKSAGTASDLAQNDLVTAAGNRYRLRFTATRSAGTLQPKIDGTAIGPAIVAAGTYEVTFTAAGGATDLAFAADAAFAGSVDDVTVRQDPDVEVGDFLVAASFADMTADWMWGAVTSWNVATGELVADIDTYGGSGAHTDWLLWLRPEEGGADQAGKTVPEPWGICRRVEPDFIGEVQGHLLYRAAEGVWSLSAAYEGGGGVPVAGAFPPAALEVFPDTDRGLAWVSNDITQSLPFTADIINGGGTQRQRLVWSQPGTVTWTVPSGVTSITAKLWGAGGGAGNAGRGGAGAFVTGAIAVTPGETLTLVVPGGGRRRNNTGTYPLSGLPLIRSDGGTGRGGGGGAFVCTDVSTGGGGGGAAAVLRASTRLAVAAGGGGGSGTADGGAGGETGEDGGDGSDIHGKGATPSAAGAGGITAASPGQNGADGDAGVVGTGGTGVSIIYTDQTYEDPCPAGGGGGYHGGGAGAADATDAGAGGGGSSYLPGGTIDDGAGPVPGGDDDPDYAAGVAIGGDSAVGVGWGGDGRIVIEFEQTVSGDAPTAGVLLRRALRDRMGYRLIEADEGTLVSVAADAETRTLTFGASIAALGLAPWDVFSLHGTAANADQPLTVLSATDTTVTVREAIVDMGADTAFDIVVGDVDGTALQAVDAITDHMGHVLRDAAETGRNVVDKILGSLGWFLDATPGGQVTFAPFGLPTEEPVAWLDEDGDIIATPVREAATPAVWRLSAGAEECYRVHSSAEIAETATTAMRQFVATQWRENAPALGTDTDVRIKDLGATTLFVPTRFAYRASLDTRVPVWRAWFTPDREVWSFEVGPRAFGLRQGQTVAIRAPSAGIDDWINVVIVGRDGSMRDQGGRLIVWR